MHSLPDSNSRSGAILSVSISSTSNNDFICRLPFWCLMMGGVSNRLACVLECDQVIKLHVVLHSSG